MYRGGGKPVPIEKRLAKLIKKTDSCWLWQGALSYKGYGAFEVKGVVYKAHRFVYEWYVGPIPDGLQLDHLCFVKHCVNPDHLEPVTNRENQIRYKRTITSCPQGHPYDDRNTRIYQGRRWCRECDRIRSKAKRDRVKSGFRGNQEPGKNKGGKRKRKLSKGMV